MINDEQRTIIKDLLILRGLTFKPLQEEMLDHICCDVEERIAEGSSFEEALRSTMIDIPEDHFKLIQKHTMDTINKRFALSQWLSYAALGFLFCSVIFKLLHLQFAGELLLLSFALIAAALLTSSVSGIYMNREKRGAQRVLAIVVGVIILLIGYGFKILQLPGADQIVVLSVIVLLGSLLINTLFVYHNATGEGNLLTYLHEKYTPGIERFLLILLLPLTLYKISYILSGGEYFAGDLILLVVIFGGGLQLIALSWRSMERDLNHKTQYILSGLLISSACFVLVFLGPIIQFEIRVLMIMLYCAVTGWLAYKLDQAQTVSSLIFACLVPLLFLGWAFVKLGILQADAGKFIFNLPVLLILAAGLFLCKKNDTMRTYMIVSLSSYLFEYLY